MLETPGLAPRPGEPQAAEECPWYQGYEMGMAFCRLTERLAAQPGTKIEKELRSLERALDQERLRGLRGVPLNLIDLGTGDGQKMLRVIAALRTSGVGSIRYVPVDTNAYISRYAILTILGAGQRSWRRDEAELLFGPLGRLEPAGTGEARTIGTEALVRATSAHPARRHWVVREGVTVPLTGLDLDFFEELSAVAGAVRALDADATNLYCLLGNTLGNYPPDKRAAFLSTACAETRTGDLLLIGVGLRPLAPPCEEAILLLRAEYEVGEAFMRLGADHPAATYRTIYDAESHRMVHGFVRPDGTLQEMGYSYLFHPGQLVRDLEAAGLEVLSCGSYPDLDGDAAARKPHAPRYLTILARRA